jgi:dynactin-4
VRFSKPTKITEQLNKIWKARHGSGEDGEAAQERRDQKGQERLQHDVAFANLSKFYKEQLNESGDQQNLYSSSPYSSPHNLARIMNLYGGLSYGALKKTREKPQPMREAGGRPEGLSAYTVESLAAEDEAITKMKTLGLDSTSTSQQKLASPSNYDARFIDQLWPVATPLRVRRGRRCRTCRQFLARPEGKVGSMRYKIRLMASLHIQRLSVRPLQAAAAVPSSSFRLKSEVPEQTKLRPFQTQHYILTVRNPLFETAKVTLSTPSMTPGNVNSRVTILCPSFTVGPAGENMWDEALSASTSSIGVASDGSRRAAMASLTGSADADRQPEAGKVWERSRNSTSVILEVIPGALKGVGNAIVPVSDEERAKEDGMQEDDDVLEIPIFVRAEWEADPAHGAEHVPAGEKKERESKELAYWCVLGVGRIAS